MHDFSLGGPVDVGTYYGLLLNGQPLHRGNCEDGVYGCRRCNRRLRRLTEKERAELRDLNYPEWRAEPNPTSICDWCNKEVPLKDIRGIRPWDEPSCYYEVCAVCKGRHDDSLRAEYEYDQHSSR